MTKDKKTEISPKQKKILKAIKLFQKDNGYFPSIREICERCGLLSTNTVFFHLKTLENKGLILKNHKGSILKANFTEQKEKFKKEKISIPFYQNLIPAGFEAPAEEAGKELITIDQYIIKNPFNTFALKVKGYSMEKAGILPGDIILVEKSATAKNGQIVVAHLQDGFTVKRYIEEKGKKMLKAESEKDYTIQLSEGSELWGVVIGSIRKYQ